MEGAKEIYTKEGLIAEDEEEEVQLEDCGSDGFEEEETKEIDIEDDKKLGGIEMFDMISVDSEEEMKHLIWFCIAEKVG